MNQQDLLFEKERAVYVIKSNSCENYTIPAPGIYLPQWNWDSAKIAIGLSHIDPIRAQQEILTLFQGQWQNGMVPHMIFHPQSKGYVPGPEFWNSRISQNAPKGIQTSGITQPPILAYTAYQIFKNSQDKQQAAEFLKQIFPKLKHYHQFFFTHRDPKDEGLAYILHVWESGMDNSPCWDSPLRQVNSVDFERSDNKLLDPNQRPKNADYERYACLVKLFQQEKYDQHHILKKTPFMVQSLFFNSLRYADLVALAEIGYLLDKDTSEIQSWISKTRDGINTKLWDADRKMYGDYDGIANQRIVTNTVAQFIPLFAGIPSADKADLIAQKLTSPEYWPADGGYPLCSVAMNDDAFEPERMWRGPVWVNTNWFAIRGLQRYGYTQVARALTERTLELVYKQGFYEHFHPITGKGGGAENFSWSAALIIDLIGTYERNSI